VSIFFLSFFYVNAIFKNRNFDLINQNLIEFFDHPPINTAKPCPHAVLTYILQHCRSVVINVSGSLKTAQQWNLNQFITTLFTFYD